MSETCPCCPKDDSNNNPPQSVDSPTYTSAPTPALTTGPLSCPSAPPSTSSSILSFQPLSSHLPPGHTPTKLHSKMEPSKMEQSNGIKRKHEPSTEISPENSRKKRNTSYRDQYAQTDNSFNDNMMYLKSNCDNVIKDVYEEMVQLREMVAEMKAELQWERKESIRKDENIRRMSEENERLHRQNSLWINLAKEYGIPMDRW